MRFHTNFQNTSIHNIYVFHKMQRVRQPEKCLCSGILKSVRTGICLTAICLQASIPALSEVYSFSDSQLNCSLNLPFYVRGRLKGKKLTGITSSNFEMYLNLPVKVHASNGNSSRSSTSSPPQPRVSLVSSGSADNQLKVAFPIDLNDKGQLQSFLQLLVTKYSFFFF